jgi:hypothetical protein
MHEKLTAEYGEKIISVGVTNDGHLAELFASDESWSFVLVLSNGYACMMSVGGAWRDLPRGNPA